jgi:hypothetical protein
MTFSSPEVGPCLVYSLITGMKHIEQSVDAAGSCTSQRGQKLAVDTVNDLLKRALTM